MQQAAGQPEGHRGRRRVGGRRRGGQREVGEQQVARVARDERRVRRADSQAQRVGQQCVQPELRRRAALQLPRLLRARRAVAYRARESEHVVGHRGARLVEG